ncbi:hypothetical protein [Agromyces sp. NPDC049794]|uniref:hypothetical protein n=1 Tax=unclassified Agromyces TaxID=2639701 RepID=UPI0033FB0113
MLEGGLRGNQALDRLTALAGTAGLGAYAGTVDAELQAARASIVRHTQSWIDQGSDMLARTNRLLADQQAASMIGTVGSVSAAIIGGAAVVGGTGSAGGVYFPEPTGPVFGPTIVGGTGSAGGVYFPEPTGPVFGPTIVGGASASADAFAANNPLTAVIAARQERSRAQLAAMSSGPMTGGANDLAVQAVTNSQSNKTFFEIMDRQAAATSLITAPSGSRINSSGSTSVGYQSAGTYGSIKIESPIYRDEVGRPVP